MGRIVSKPSSSDDDRLTWVCDGGRTLQVMIDPRTEQFGRVILVNRRNNRTVETFVSSKFAQPGENPRAEVAFHREMIEGMTRDEVAAYFLKDVLGVSFASDLDTIKKILVAIPGLPRGDGFLVYALWRVRPNIVDYLTLGQRIEEFSGSWPDARAIQSSLKRARRALRQTDYPIQIETYCKVGLSLHTPDNWQAPWEAAVPRELPTNACGQRKGLT